MLEQWENPECLALNEQLVLHHDGTKCAATRKESTKARERRKIEWISIYNNNKIISLRSCRLWST
jgi:hypothetical protein